MERHDYHEEMKADIIEYLKEEYTTEEIKRHLEDKDEFYEKLYDDLWVTDSVTGNASGSYTFNTWEAEENLCHNLGLLKDALDEFGSTLTDALEKGAEFCDVTIRCYMLGSVLYQVLNELEWGGGVKMIYIVLSFVSLVMILGTVATVTKAGQNDGICKYGHDDE